MRADSRTTLAITLEDAGDAGLDSGPRDGGDDARYCGSVVGSREPFPSLPARCLPRCSRATYVAYRACNDVGTEQYDACIASALESDTTPTAYVDTGGSALLPDAVACAPGDTTWSCIEWQQFVATGRACPAETRAVFACHEARPLTGATDCATENMAVRDCTTANRAAWWDAFDVLLPQCFPR